MAEATNKEVQPKVYVAGVKKGKKKVQLLQYENNLQATTKNESVPIKLDVINEKKGRKRNKKKRTSNTAALQSAGANVPQEATSTNKASARDRSSFAGGRVSHANEPSLAKRAHSTKGNPPKKGAASAKGAASSKEGQKTIAELPSFPVIPSDKRMIMARNYVFPLTERSAKNPNASFLCKVCKYYCDNITVVEKHLLDDRHRRGLELEDERRTAMNLPAPTPAMLKTISALLTEEFNKHGLNDEDIKIRQSVATRVADLILEKLPGFDVRMYGSSASGFGLKSSDVNLELCVPAEKSAPKGLIVACEALESDAAYTNVVREFTADIPAVRFVDSNTQIPCSLTISNDHSYKIAVLFCKYASINENVRILGTVFRLWAKECKLDSAEAGMWPPYAFQLLLIYFLQQLNDPVLPVLHELKTPTKTSETGPETYFDSEDLDAVWSSKNTMSLAELWLQLFRYYAYDFAKFDNVVCIEQSAPLKRNENAKRWLGKKMAIRDPFLPKRNVSRSMTNQLSFDYCMECFRNTYKYFAIIQTEIGPIFKNILKPDTDQGDLLNSMLKSGEELAKDVMNGHPYFKKDETTIIMVSKLEDELRHINLQKEPNKPAYTLDFSLTVSLECAEKMFKRFDSVNLLYHFRKQYFVGSQKYPEICATCHMEGHSKEKCKDNILPPFDAHLPPQTEEMRGILDILCKYVYERYSISPEEVEARSDIIREMEKYIVIFFPTAKLDLFGSSCNGFGLRKSDIDICLTFTDSETGKEHNFVQLIEELMQKLKRFDRVRNLIPVTAAKVPILKFYHMASGLEGDISIYNTLGQQNTRLLKTYSEIDIRVKMLGYMMKSFAKVCDMCDASRGSLSSYAYIIMVIYFLQQCNPPVLPVLQELSETEPRPQVIVEECDTYFYQDLENLPKLWPEHGKNTASVGELWLQLLKYYSVEFDFTAHVISIRQRERLLRFEKLWTSKWMAIEDPFDLTHNLGAGLSPKMHVYIVKAFRNGYLHFGHPMADGVPTNLVVSSPGSSNVRPGSLVTLPFSPLLGIKSEAIIEQYFFSSGKLTSGEPPNDRGCRICKKIGHGCRDCPQRNQGRNKKTTARVGRGATGKNVGISTAQNPGLLSLPFGLPHYQLHEVQTNRRHFHSPGESVSFRGNYAPMQRSQEPAGMRYGIPQVPPPFNMMCASPFANTMNVRPRVTADAGPKLEARSGGNKQYANEYYEMTRHLQRGRNTGRNFNLKPTADKHFRIPQVKNDAVMVEVFSEMR